MNYMDLLGGGFPPGFEGLMPQPQQMQGMGGLFGGGGPPPQASQLPGVTQMPQFGQTPLQGMGLQSPFLTERPPQALPTQGFVPSRTNTMGPNAMAMLGMNPNFGNMVGPTSALPPEMQPQASQLKMWGMEDQLANPPAPAPTPPVGQQNAFTGGYIPIPDGVGGEKNVATGSFYDGIWNPYEYRSPEYFDWVQGQQSVQGGE